MPNHFLALIVSSTLVLVTALALAASPAPSDGAPQKTMLSALRN